MKKLTREEALEIVINTLEDRVSGPTTEDILKALGISTTTKK